MKKVNVYSNKGVKQGVVALPKSLQGEKNAALLAQALRVYTSRSHPGLSKTKTRGEIKISTRKIYRQKGTGMARHGAKSAPIFVGGGKAHGPDGRKRELVLPGKMKKKALTTALRMKVDKGSLVVIKGLSGLKKTKETAALIEKVVKHENLTNGNNRFSFIISDGNRNVRKVIRNIQKVKILPFENLNAYDVYFGGILFLDSEIIIKKDDLKKKNPSKTKTKTEGKQ